jgi:hypothetical protein
MINLGKSIKLQLGRDSVDWGCWRTCEERYDFLELTPILVNGISSIKYFIKGVVETEED